MSDIRPIALGLALVVFPTPTRAAPPPTPSQATPEARPTPARIRLGIRLGYGAPLGAYDQNFDLSDSVTGQIPIGVDVGYMVSRHILLGLYGQYGIGQTNCDVCSPRVIRFGIQAHYQVAPTSDTNPWFGAGFGYEILTGDDAGLTRGFEFANLQGGVLLNNSQPFSVGPFLGISLARYSHGPQLVEKSSFTDPNGSSFDIEVREFDDKAFHGWLTIGVMGTFSL